ncbi:dephospho-CoA kinase [Polymorphobacter glacialis]|uniref:Dephospho-CoA kinase n=1 Tax=Sandarakinorhabdus glacialis TaxID=1614636 RepID=A0A916ZQU0_9SPHN|nr:dephospho-CoA kinase [Polymorphobacter glacialis]GGE09542.1 dephospho-CoA kinase [Polymorphobacter glacialis]
MIIIGLTGSIGMGKSTVAAMFESLGVPVFDADAEVRNVQGPGGRALAAIEAEFPGTTHAGGLHREKLGAHVFGNAASLRKLEKILHPLVAEAQSAFLGAHRQKDAVILDVPLLFEKGGWKRCHMSIVVSAPYRVQRARVLARPGMTEAKFAGILKSQMPDREKRKLADVVIETGRGRRHTWLAVNEVVKGLRREGA